jgi:hypothetical protein
MQFFKHYTNMRHNLKIKKLVIKYGLRGYGLYNLIIESITENLCSENPLPELKETAADIALLYSEDTTMINEIMAYMLNNDLFELNEITGKITCSNIYKYIDKAQTRSEEIRKMIELYKNESKLPVSDISRQDRTKLIDIDIDIDIELDIYKDIEEKYFITFENIYKNKPMYEYGINRRFLKNKLKSLTKENIIIAIDNASKDVWFTKNISFTMLNILSDKNINKFMFQNNVKTLDNSIKKDNYNIPAFANHVDLDEAMNGKK